MPIQMNAKLRNSIGNDEKTDGFFLVLPRLEIVKTNIQKWFCKSFILSI